MSLGVSDHEPLFLMETMVPMAGRPRKDPSGASLLPITIAVTGVADKAIRAQAARHGMSIVDYLCALVAADSGCALPGVPPLQEVFDLQDSA